MKVKRDSLFFAMDFRVGCRQCAALAHTMRGLSIIKTARLGLSSDAIAHLMFWNSVDAMGHHIARLLCGRKDFSPNSLARGVSRTLLMRRVKFTCVA